MILGAQVAILPVDHRRRIRRIVNFEAILREVDCTARLVTVRDLSETGCKVAPFSDGELGDELLIKLPGTAALRARLAWRHGVEAGCEFTEPLHSCTVADLSRVDGSTEVKRVFTAPTG
jgi:hypothetical protein